MSEFEFQRYVTIGQYIPTDSIIHRLDPRTRIMGGLFLLLAVTLAPSLAGLLLALVLVVALTRMARVPVGYALRGLLAPLPFIAFLALLQVVLSPASGAAPTLWQWGPLRISMLGIANSIRVVLRFPALILLITTASACTSTSEMVRGLEALLHPLTRIRLPVQDFVLMVQVALRFVPLLAREAERIAKSQASRGAVWGTGRGGPLRRARQALPIFVPLFLVSLQRAESLAIAMDARGYRSFGERTSLVSLHFTRADFLALLACLAASVLIGLV
ncbi:MAG: energy-coupling factor transporter transmembrane protein EcfT [Anaerolineae bacterium]|nr:energy-coupling factor transporter transmembrane protein EcfT [Anaerolineae bacterium]